MISICIVTQNNEQTIKETLDSIARQTYVDFECIIVDEFSTDSTASIVASVCKGDDRFKLYMNCANRNLPYTDAHNKSYRYASGEYLFRVNPDDILMPNHIQVLVEYMNDHTEIDVCCTRLGTCTFREGTWEMNNVSLEIDNERIKKLREYPIVYFQDTSWYCLSEIFHNETSAIRKSSYDRMSLEFMPHSQGYADNVFWRFACARGAKFDYINETTVVCKNQINYAHSKPAGPFSDFYCAVANYLGHLQYLEDHEQFFKDNGGKLIFITETFLNTIVYYMKALMDLGIWDEVPSYIKYITPETDKI